MTIDSSTPESEAPAPAAVPAKPEEKVGHDGKLYLPTPHPLVQSPKEGSIGDKINGAWRTFNYFLRGLYGTFVEWGVSWMDLALEYPRVALAFVVIGGVTIEETMNEHPYVSGLVRYVMYSLDEEAGRIIFPPETEISEAEKVIDKMAAQILDQSAEDYYNSAEYKELEMEVRLRMHQQVRESLYEMSGIPSLDPSLVVTPETVEPVPVEEMEPVPEEPLDPDFVEEEPFVEEAEE
jgi:hypothetical protein